MRGCASRPCGRLPDDTPLAEDGTFHFAVTPGPARINAYGQLTGQVYRLVGGRALVDVASGESTQIEIRVAAGALIRFRSKSPWPAGRFALEVASGDRDWQLADACVLAKSGYLSFEANVPLGLLRWRLRFSADGRGELAIVASGEDTVQQSIIEIVLPEPR